MATIVRGKQLLCECGNVNECRTCRSRENARRKRQGLDLLPLVHTPRNCANEDCKDTFVPSRKSQIYCCVRCSERAKGARYRKERPERLKAAHKRWYDQRGKGVRAAYSNKRGDVYWQVRKALDSGALVKQPCEVCGDESVDAHHDDYSKPLDVRWLCRKHHRAVHRGEG